MAPSLPVSDPTASALDPRIRLGKDGTFGLFGWLTGHGLRAHGEPYLAVDCTRDRCATNLHATVHQENRAARWVGGKGHGVCRCGVLSPHLASYRRRRRWHRQHKARIVLGLPEPKGQPKRVLPQDVA